MGVFAQNADYVPPNEARLKLTASKVKSAKPSAKAYKLADGAGMYLLVHPSGAKYWRLKYRIAGKEKLRALGVYPEVSLAEARIRRDNARLLIRDGRDPGVAKQLQKKFLQNQNSETLFSGAIRALFMNSSIHSYIVVMFLPTFPNVLTLGLP